MTKKSILAIAILGFSLNAMAADDTTDETTEESVIACTDEELTAYMDNYEAGLQKAVSMVPQADYKDFKKMDLIRRLNSGKDDEETTLCSVIADSSFDVSSLMPDWEKAEELWASMKALFAGNSGGADYGTLISEAVSKGMAAAKEKAKEGFCALQKGVTSNIDKMGNDLYKKAKSEGKKMVLSNDTVKELGVTTFNKPVWQQMAGKQLDNQLGEYSKYSKWYEDGWSVSDATGDLINDESKSATNDWLKTLDDDNSAADTLDELGVKKGL